MNDTNHSQSIDKATILAQALPYIRKFHGKTLVISRRQAIICHARRASSS